MRIFFLSLLLVLALGQHDINDMLFRNDDFGTLGNFLSRLWVPPEAETQNGKFPLVIFLHGIGERGNDNVKQLRNPQFFTLYANDPDQPAFISAPQIPTTVSWGGTPIQQIAALVERLLEEYPKIDANRVYITGLSLGGFGTLNSLAQFPDLYAAGIPVCGGGQSGNAATLITTPIWFFHNKGDPTVAWAPNSLRTYDAMIAAGGCPKKTWYDSTTHNAWSAAYGTIALRTWTWKQKLSKGAGCPVPECKVKKNGAGCILVDDSSPCVIRKGTWQTSTNFEPYREGGYIHNNKQVASELFYPFGGKEGFYNVFWYYSANGNRDTQVPVSVVGKKTSSFEINQQLESGYDKIGRFHLVDKEEHGFEVRSEGTTGYVVSDTVKFCPYVLKKELKINSLTLSNASGKVRMNWTSSNTANGVVYQVAERASKNNKWSKWKNVGDSMQYKTSINFGTSGAQFKVRGKYKSLKGASKSATNN